MNENDPAHLKRAPQAGGLGYHARALMRAPIAWRGYREWVERRLASWSPAASETLIFGPSAGYALPGLWLAKLDSVICVEPDPIARALLRARLGPGLFGNSRLAFLDAPEALGRLANAGDASALARVVDAHPRAVVLFANVLGQLPFLCGARGARLDPRWTDEFARAMQGRRWASFHDLLSVRAAVAPLSAARDDLRAPAPEAWPEFLASEWPGDGGMPEAIAEARDHETAGLGGTLARWWPLTAREWHLVAWKQNEF